MFKIEFSLKSIEYLKHYISWYKTYFKNLFINTWLVWEEEIIKSYIVIADNFYNLVIDNIFIVLSSDIVWNMIRGDKIFVTITIKNYRVFVYFNEDKVRKIRYIEDIEIFKK